MLQELQQELNNKKQRTENGAVGYRTTGKKLLDLNFKIASLRSADEKEIQGLFTDAFYENPIAALRWLFFARDARQGCGERRLFRVCVNWLADNRPELVVALLPLFPEYGRWDDLIRMADSTSEEVSRDAQLILKNQLINDEFAKEDGKPASLLAKWLPRTNTSSRETRARGKRMAAYLGMKESQYRKKIASLNRYLNTVEVKLSANEWDTVDYVAVPSRANLLYNSAFLRHDEERRRAYLESLKKGETKINAGVLFPHDIVHKYMSDGWGWNPSAKAKDTTLEELWKALPDYVQGAGNTIVVADGSGSMLSTIGGSGVTALDVANALAIYFAEHMTGEFKDTYITFSNAPQIVDFSKAHSLREKLEIALRHDEVANTDIEAVFRLILKTAQKNDMSQEDLPANILIISDMEFDQGTHGKPDKALFKTIAKDYEKAGYKLPRLVFWNVNSRTGTVPVKENDLGVALVSGFSPTIANMVLSGELDAYKCLMNEIGKERYDAVEAAVAELL